MPPLQAVTDVAASARAAGLFRRTPLIHSPRLSEKCQQDVYLKLDCLQTSGSFKDRGMAHLCWHLKHVDKVQKLVASSGGNAGLAVATVGAQLGLQVQVVIPQTTKPLVIAKLKALGASVHVHGENWNAADALAREWVDQDPTASYISPYDHPLLWTGHSTLVDEVVEDLATYGRSEESTSLTTPSGIGTLILSVGGGGLLCGALEGLERYPGSTSSTSSTSSPTTRTRVLAAETTGASSFGQAWEAGRPVRLPAITSLATSLGALEVTPVSLQRATQAQMSSTSAVQCTDAEAVDACLQLAHDHRLLVEPACGAALAVAYSERLRQEYLLPASSSGPIVIEVCGGSAVNIDLLQQWKQELNL